MKRLVAATLAALALPAAAAHAGQVRFKLPVPVAGDVTLARAQFVTTGRGGVFSDASGTSRFGEGVRVAVLSKQPVRSRRGTLIDAFYAVAAPIESGAVHNPSRFTVRLHNHPGTVRLIHLLAVPNALARANKEDATCPTLSGGFSQSGGRTFSGWIFHRNGPRWAGLSPRTFALDAYDYGCGDGVAAGGGLFAQALLAPANSLWSTWRQLGDGTVRVCEYLTGAPGTRGTIDLLGPSGSLGAKPYAINDDGFGGAAWVTPPGTFHAALVAPRGSIDGSAFTVPPGTDGSAPSVEQQVEVGPC